MVSKTSDDLPDPDTPVMTVSWLCGMESEMFLRLWTRAPRIRMNSSTSGLTVLYPKERPTLDYTSGLYRTTAERTHTNSQEPPPESVRLNELRHFQPSRDSTATR